MYYQQPRRGQFLIGSGLSSAVAMLLAWNFILFLLQQLIRTPVLVEIGGRVVRFGVMSYYFGLRPEAVWDGWIWQLVTYMFLHGSLFHILFNMLALFMFGAQLEQYWGTRRFVKYYFFTGIGAGVLTALFQPGAVIPTIGASGAIWGLLLAYGVLFPNRQILLYFLFPIPAKYFVIIFGAIEFVASLGGSNTGVAHITHVGGLVCGWIYLKGFPGQGLIRRWRRDRQRRKFRVVNLRDWDEPR